MATASEREARPQRGGAAEALNLVIPAVAAVYLGLAIRQVYAPSRLATAFKTMGLFMIYQGLLSVWMASAIGFAYPALL